MAMGGKETGDRQNKLGTQLASPVLDDDNPCAQALHGHPVTISQCTFQAHIAR